MLGKRSKYQSSVEVEWLIACLGNPGREYEASRHNVGFRVFDELVARHRISLVDKHQGRYGTGTIGDVDVALIAPQTYMNLSGQSVKPALKALDLTPRQLLVVHDEIDLDWGVLQLKDGGGLAGHNGLRSISDLLSTRDFLRLRMGVGRPEKGDRRPIADWVLTPIEPHFDVDAMVKDAADAVELLLERGQRTAMNQVNGNAGNRR